MTPELTVIQKLPTASTPEGHVGHAPLATGTLLEGLEIGEVLGLGGFGIVYRAWDPALERQVALKEYFPNTLACRTGAGEVKPREARYTSTYEAGLKSFVNEARLLAQFDHPALVKVYRFWEMAGTAYMVMPLYKGPNLKQYMQKHEAPLKAELLLEWLTALTLALETMHSQNCYHRDISPENIVIQEDSGLPILLDFGAARRVIGSIAQPFTVILKASYAPVEQYAEVPSMDQGPWTDVYALAAVAHFLITGNTPPSSVGRLVADSHLPLALSTHLPYEKHVLQAIDRALAVQPHERTQSMAQFRKELLTAPQQNSSLLDSSSLDALLAEPPQKPAAHADASNGLMPAFKEKIHLAMLAGLLLLILPVVGWWWLRAPSEVKVATSPHGQQAVAAPLEIFENPAPTTAVGSAFQAVLNKADQPLQVNMEKTVLRIGEDLLQFSIQSPFDGFVSVFVLSSDNTLVQLLPNTRVPVLSIQAGQNLTLPPAKEPIQAAGPTGMNQVLVVVTERQRSHAQLDLQQYYGFGMVKNLDGPLEGTSPCVDESCMDRLAAAWFSVEEVE